jgi:hypothetical protein
MRNIERREQGRVFKIAYSRKSIINEKVEK